MMNHSAQESRACSVLAKLHALRTIREMRRSRKLRLTGCGECEWFALNPHQRALDILLHGATGRGVRLHSWRVLRRKDLYSDARQE